LKRLNAKEQKELIKEWRDNNNSSSLNKLIESNRNLVYKIAQKQYANNRNLEFEDLVQEGFLGLSIAVDKFDLSKDNKFTTYATGWVLQRIRSYIISNRSVVRLGTTQDNRKVFYYYNKVKNQIEKEYPELKGEAKTTLICETMGVKRKNLDKMLNVISGYDVSFEKEIKSGNQEANGASTMHDLLADKDSDFYSRVEEKDCIDKFVFALTNVMSTDLDSEEREVINKRYLRDERMTYDQIAKSMDVSRQYIMTREQTALKIIRAKIKLRFKLDKSCFF
jgi:RNA polymerase sigma-32 factor